MRSALAALAALVLLVAVPGAMADGSPYAPGLVQGATGVRATGSPLRFVTLATSRSTVVAAIRIRSGRVLRTNVLRGFWGVPIVAWDGSTGGVSGDGQKLVLASYGPLPGNAGVTRFAILGTRTLRKIRTFGLPGSWAFDAIAPDGSKIFLIEYLSAGQTPRYRVRLFDAETGRLDPEAIVDRREKEVLMRGQPVTRKVSFDGRWAYTLYARQKSEPFVHALDTVKGESYCIDLPLRLGQLEQMALRLKVRRDGALEIRRGRSELLLVDMEKLDVREG